MICLFATVAAYQISTVLANVAFVQVGGLTAAPFCVAVSFQVAAVEAAAVVVVLGGDFFSRHGLRLE